MSSTVYKVENQVWVLGVYALMASRMDHSPCFKKSSRTPLRMRGVVSSCKFLMCVVLSESGQCLK